jgi:hypothetical protein
MLAQIARAVTVGAVRGRRALRCVPAAASPADYTPVGSDVAKEELVKESVSKSGAEGSNRRQIMVRFFAIADCISSSTRALVCVSRRSFRLAERSR